MPPVPPLGPNALLDVVLGYDCNLACTYCTISPEMRPRSVSPERVVLEIDRAAERGYRYIAFTGGEPTLFPALPALVKHAKRRGFARVKIASNGLRYAHAPYLDLLLRCGANELHVSMHARADVAYDATVRLEGASLHRRRAIDALVSRGLDPVADLILKEDTYREIDAWIEDLLVLGVRRFALWLVSLTDHNAGNVHQLPSIPSVVPHLIRAFDRARANGHEVVSLHVPRCFLRGYEDHVRHPGADGVRVVTPDDVFDLRASRLTGGVFPEGCAGCKYESSCPGLRRDYVDRFGGADVGAVV